MTHNLDLEHYMCSRYVNGGRVWPELDCYGMARLAFMEVHEILLPLLKGLDASSLIGKSRHYQRITQSLRAVDPQHGAIAAVVTGKACEHVGICVTMAGAVWVLETTVETGPRMMPMPEFIKEYANVICYAPA